MPAIIDFLQQAVTQYVWPIFAVVLALGIAILLHEFGHFIVARLAGVRAETFSIGFGKALWSRKWGGTEFRIAAIPLGGFVRLRGILSEEAERYLMGEDEEQTDKKEGERAEKTEKGEAKPPDPETELVDAKKGDEAEAKPENGGDSVASIAVRDAMQDGLALRNKIWPVRVAVFMAGCGFNFLVAAFLYGFLAWVGVEESAPFPSVVGTVKEGTSVYQAGLRAGDRIVELAGVPVSTWNRVYPEDPPEVVNVINELLASKTTGTVVCKVRRTTDEGEEVLRALRLPPPTDLAKAYNDGHFGERLSPAYIAGLIPFSPAKKAGLKRGDIIVGISGQPVEDTSEVVEIVSASLGKPLDVRVKRGDKEFTIEITPEESDDKEPRGVIGVRFGNVDRIWFHRSFLKAWPYGFGKAAELTAQVAVGTALVFSSGVRSIKKNVAGPVGIVGIMFERARQGWRDFLMFTAFLNIALLIFNLLPIPILDGGHIVITTYESVARRPIPPRVLAAMFYVFFFLIISLVLMVTIFDVMRFADFLNIGKIFQ